MKKRGIMYYYYNEDILKDLEKVILEERVSTICVNDTPFCNQEDFELASKSIKASFEKKFPDLSMYERAI